MNYTELDLENIEMQQVEHAAEQKVFKIRRPAFIVWLYKGTMFWLWDRVSPANSGTAKQLNCQPDQEEESRKIRKHMGSLFFLVMTEDIRGV